MERFAFFVDAGYVLECGARILKQPGRAQIRCNYKGLTEDLQGRIEEYSAGTLRKLRLYWYDAAVDAIPDAEQQAIAKLAHVKLRLGRLVNKRQKGVDALIMRDLMTLARERAMVVAYLVSGDEDLREGVMAVQDMGVQVVLVGFDGPGQAQTLINEADEHMVFPDSFWQTFFTVRSQPGETSERSRVSS
jgi:hypothetical protein